MNEHSPDPYEILHLGPAATAREIARAYRSLMRSHHPDTRSPGAVPTDQESGAREIKELHDIMDAYAVLGDPARRAAYDQQRRGSPPPEPAPPPRPHAPSGPALIIGPVRWENPGEPVPGRQFTGRWDQFERLPAPAARGNEPSPGGYRILWWIHR